MIISYSIRALANADLHAYNRYSFNVLHKGNDSKRTPEYLISVDNDMPESPNMTYDKVFFTKINTQFWACNVFFSLTLITFKKILRKVIGNNPIKS